MSTCTPARYWLPKPRMAAVKEGKEQLKSRLGKKVAGAVDDDWQQAPAPPDLSLTPVCRSDPVALSKWDWHGTSPLRERILFLCFCLFCCHPWPWQWLDYGSSLSSSSWSLALAEPCRICVPDVFVMQKGFFWICRTHGLLSFVLYIVNMNFTFENRMHLQMQICAIDILNTFCCFLFVTPFGYLPDQLFLMLCHLILILSFRTWVA